MSAKRILYLLPVIVLITLVFSGCVRTVDTQRGLAFETLSYRDVPGITTEEIAAIEELKNRYGHFTYGMLPSTEAFIAEDGKIGGFSALFCEWLSGFFGIPFEPVTIRSPDILGVILRGEVDFSGDLRVTQERHEIYIATDPIALRSMKMVRLEGSQPISSITSRRLPRYAFIKDSVAIDDVAAVIES